MERLEVTEVIAGDLELETGTFVLRVQLEETQEPTELRLPWAQCEKVFVWFGETVRRFGGGPVPVS